MRITKKRICYTANSFVLLTDYSVGPYQQLSVVPTWLQKQVTSAAIFPAVTSFVIQLTPARQA